MKTITHGEDTRKKLASGISKLAAVVKPTLGPKAKHVVLGFEFQNPQVLDDGALIARHVELEDETENIGVQLARMVSEKTNRIAGDGTTTSIVLADAFTQAMVESDGGFSSSSSRREELERAEKTIEAILLELKSYAKPIKDNEDIKRVALISSGTQDVANIIAQAYQELGDNAIVTYQNSKKDGISMSVSRGMRIMGGVAPHFLNKGRTTVVGGSKVLIIDGPCVSKALVAAAVKEADGVGALTVIADEFSEEILDVMMMSTAKGYQFFPVIAPYYAQRRSEVLKDIAAFCSAKVLTKEYVADSLGMANRVEASTTELILVGGMGDVTERVAEIKEQIEGATAEYDVATLKERIASLESGVATINVGMPTEAEQLSVVNKIEDAINAVKSALDGGIVAGGGVALFLASNATTGLVEAHRGILTACSAPLRQIQENLGVKTEDWGLDVVDPLKTVVQALTNAWSIARLVALSESGVVWKKEPSDKSDTQ